MGCMPFVSDRSSVNVMNVFMIFTIINIDSEYTVRDLYK